MSYPVTIDGIEYKVLSECGEWDWSWRIGAVLRNAKHADGQLYWLEDSGCSCKGFGEDVRYENLVPLDNWQHAVLLSKKAGFSDTHVAEFAEKLMRVMR